MRPVLLIFTTLVILLSNCKKSSILSLSDTKRNQIIAFVPFDDYNVLEITSVINEVSHFYNKKVIILNPVDIPVNFFNPAIQQYSADSLIMLLSKFRNDTIIEIIGLTHKPVFTTKQAKPMDYFAETIFGMAYQPGNSCIVSDFKFRTTDIKIYNQRLRNVIIHETGHNLGLSHCKDGKCIMSENNGDIKILDKSENNYCRKCRKILYN